MIPLVCCESMCRCNPHCPAQSHKLNFCEALWIHISSLLNVKHECQKHLIIRNFQMHALIDLSDMLTPMYSCMNSFQIFITCVSIETHSLFPQAHVQNLVAYCVVCLFICMCTYESIEGHRTFWVKKLMDYHCSASGSFFQENYETNG